ncbi:schwannomin-interacting protein 1 [Biomphalaria glabrata]|nr:schwannomin-interacting protein 1 [Biomphalaria glabrata]
MSCATAQHPVVLDNTVSINNKKQLVEDLTRISGPVEWSCDTPSGSGLEEVKSQLVSYSEHRCQVGQGEDLSQGSASLESNLSDHDDEDSETESAIATNSAMTLLTPEDNQGGGDDSSATAAVDSDDDELNSSINLDTLGSNILSEDISPPLPDIDNPVPCLKPVLDSQDILSGLEREKRSPSRFSVDVECESIVSDYSELGGPLKDIERDVNFVDKDFLRTDDVFAVPALSSAFWEQEELEKRDGETEEDFERRVRKVNLLSLAQEFAELKKVDSQACAINFHKNQSVRNLARGVSPLNSRGQSLERVGRRATSKSPLRCIGRRLSKELPGEASMNKTCAESTHNTSLDLHANLQGKPLANMVVPKADDLPVNEARRRDSNSDLPANMRPDRCANSPNLGRSAKMSASNRSRDGSGSRVGVAKNQQTQQSSDCEGDFEVYNIETTLPQMNWELLEKQLQAAAEEEKQRLEHKCIPREPGFNRINKGDKAATLTRTFLAVVVFLLVRRVLEHSCLDTLSHGYLK